MIVRLKRVFGRPEDIDSGRRFFEEVVLPCCQTVAGFQCAWFLGDVGSGRTVTISAWDSEAAYLEACRELHRSVTGDPAKAATHDRISEGETHFEGYELLARSERG